MADGSNTLSPASVWFVGAGETIFDVTDFSIEEPINGLFQVVVHASSPDGTIDPTTFIGKGGAFRFRHHAGDLVRAGICSEAAQVQNQPDGAVTLSTYRFVIVSALSRTTLRVNNRNFQGLTVPEIVFAILDEWKIPYDKDLKEPHRKHEYRVQYNETDFAFISRLLEEEGISYWFDHAIKSGAGSTVTSVFFSDQPELGKSLGPFPYRQTGAHKTFQDGENVIFNVVVTQRMKFGTSTIRDFDLRLAPDLNLAHSERAVGATPEELKYEDYQYAPGAFRAIGDGDAQPTPVADNPLKVRTVDEQKTLRMKREIGSARNGHTTISFQTSALEWAPGDVLLIGKGDQKHPSPQVNGKKMLVTRRRLSGSTSGIRDQRIDVTPADVPYRPARKTPKARILGLQSAIVVGPKDQEIHTDELGRVRVQFHWDREHGYDEKSSCWIRVSQGWAGSGFGLIALPRVGHEVLVGFYEGDPDRPVVVGRVFNRRNVVPETLAAHKTKSGWRTESSGGAQSQSSRGYNELLFEDAKGQESISIRAQKNMSTLVKGSESRNIGGARSTRVGEVDVANVGAFSQVLVGKEVGLEMAAKGDILLSNGHASIRLSGDDIYVEAEGNLLINMKGGILLSSLTVVDVVGGPEVCINCDEGHADKAGGPAAPTAIGPATKPGGGPPIPPPFFPKRDPVPPPPPLGFEEIKVGNEASTSNAKPLLRPTPAAHVALPVVDEPCAFVNGTDWLVAPPQSAFERARRKVQLSAPKAINYRFPGSTKDEPALEYTAVVDSVPKKIVYPTSPSPKESRAPVTVYADALGSLTRAQYASFPQLIVSPHDNPDDAYWAEEYKIPKARSAARGGTSSVDFFPAASVGGTSGIAQYLVHESAHALSAQLRQESEGVAGFIRGFFDSGKQNAASAKAWDDAIKADGRCPSGYSKGRPAEDFAESTVLYSASKGTPCEEAARRAYPNRYRLLDVINGATPPSPKR